MTPHLRVARPVSDLERSAAMYARGLGLVEVFRFADHDGFDGVMLAYRDGGYHFEFTHCTAHAVAPTPTAEDRDGRTFEDPDGYRTVLQRAAWPG